MTLPDADMRPTYQQILREAAGIAGEGWSTISIVSRRVARYAETDITATYADGGTRQLSASGTSLLKLIRGMRRQQYRPGTGAWFTAELRFMRAGTFSADFDYDDEPQWYAPIPPENYVEELERFPRDDEHIPDWMRSRLESAAKADWTPEGGS